MAAAVGMAAVGMAVVGTAVGMAGMAGMAGTVVSGVLGAGGGGWGPALGVGLYFATLPAFYSTYWWGGVPYYYAGNNYFIWNGAVGQYQTVAPPPEVLNQVQVQGEGQGAAPSDIVVYPKNGAERGATRQAIDSSAIAGPSHNPALIRRNSGAERRLEIALTTRALKLPASKAAATASSSRARDSFRV